MTLDSVANFIQLTASQGYGSTDTSIVVAAVPSDFPSAPFNLVWWDSTAFVNPLLDPNVEIVRVTNISGTTLTVARAEEQTSASTKNTSGHTYSLILAITAKMITDIGNNLQQPWKYVNVDGTIDGTNTTFTLHGSIAPFDPNSLQITLARQPQLQGIDYTISGTTISYITPPSASLSGQPHKAQYQ
jgi:hypothetical protein